MELDLFTVFLIILGAGTLVFAFFWALLRFDAWLEGRPW